jgi:hypothetical protein
MEYADLALGEADAAFVEALRAEPDPRERIRMVARGSRELWVSGALEMDLMISNAEPKDVRLEELQRRSLEYRLESTREVCEVLFPDDIRRPDVRLEDIVAFGTAVDSAAVVTTLVALGWSMDQWETWLVQLLELFLDPAHVPDAGPSPDREGE